MIFELKIVFNAAALSHHIKEKLEQKDKLRTTKTENLVKRLLKVSLI